MEMQYRAAGYTLIACDSIAYAAPSVYAAFAREIIMSIGSRRATIMDAGDRVEGLRTPSGVSDARRAISATMDARRLLAVTTLAAVAVYGAIWLLHSATGDVAYVLLIPIVAHAAWYRGVRAGIAAALAALLVLEFSPLAPGDAGPSGSGELVALASTMAVSAAAVSAVEWLRRVQHRSADLNGARDTLLDERAVLLRTVLSNEERWRVLTDAVPALMTQLTPEGDIVYSNRRTTEYTGETLNQLRQGGWSRIIHPDDREESRAHWNNAFAAGARTQFEQRIRCSDGSHRRHLVTAEPLREPSGAITTWLAAAVDIEDSKRVEDALASSEQQYRELSDAMPALVALVDLDGDKHFRNRAFYDYTGLTEAEATDWAAQGLLFQEDLVAIAETWRATTASGKTATAEVRVRRHDGVFRWHLVRAVPLGSRSRWLLVATDIDERKAVERQLREAIAVKDSAVEQHRFAEQQLTLLVEASTGLVDSLELADIVPRILRMAMRFIVADGYALWSINDSRDQWSILASEGLSDRYLSIGSTIPLTDLTPSLTAPLMIEDVAAAPILEERRAGYELEGIKSVFVLPLAVGGENTGTLTFYYRSTHIFAEGEMRISTALANLTAAALGLARLNRGERQIREGLEMANEQLAMLAEELRDANAVKDEFLGMVSHELKTPITVILGGSEVLSKYDDRLGTDDRRETLADIHESAKRLGQLVDNLLLVSRLDVGTTIEVEPILVRHELERVIADFRRREPNRDFTLTIDPIISPVSAEATNFQQILQNLIGNAIKYSPPGSPIDVTTERHGAELVVCVLDRGKGITPAELELVFEPFYRSKRTSEAVGGAGVGLAVCRRLIEAQGGRIWAHPREGGGSVFCIALPVDLDAGLDVEG